MKNQQLKAMMAQQIANSEKNTSEEEVKVLNNEELKSAIGGGSCNGFGCFINTGIDCPAK